MLIDLKPGDKYFILVGCLYRLRVNKLSFLYKDATSLCWDPSNHTKESFLHEKPREIPFSEVVLMDLEKFSI